MKWTVGTKIGAGYGLAFAIFIAVGAMSYLSSRQMTQTSAWVTHSHRVLEQLDGLLQALTDAETGQRGFLITNQEFYLEPYQNGLTTIDQHFKEIRELTMDNPHQQKRLDLMEPLLNQRQQTLKEGVDLVKSQGVEAGRKWVLSGKGRQEMDGLRQLIADMKQEETDLLKIRNDEAMLSARNARLVIWAGSISALFILGIAGLLITRNISIPLRQITSTAQRLAEGDVNVHLNASHRTDEVGMLTRTFGVMTQSLRQMAEVAGQIAEGNLRVSVKPQGERDVFGNAFALMVANLRRLTSQLAEGVNVLSSSANEISTTTTQLASSAAQTATAITQTTTTVEEVRQTTQLASQKSRTVSENSQKVAQTAQVGRKSAEAAMEGMQCIRQQMESIADGMVRLSEQSQTVGQIISTVDDLAAQSNLLAVNAAIEAAKAGDQGKGFAIVALEVRSLAEQSKQATSQVRSVLNEIQKATSSAVMVTEQGSKAVEAGAKQSAEAGQSIQTLTTSVTDAAQAATQIAASSQQQSVGMEQVASAMENIKQASMQNMASAKQLESAAHNLKDLGRRLQQTMEQYKV